MTSVQPSKKWEIPARPKPGRKPLSSTSATSNSGGGSGDSKSSQKAHRERKATYIAELEAKVRAYEVEDGSKAVFFQRVAQKLKFENDTLRALVKSLRAELEKRPPAEASSPPATRASKRSLPAEPAEEDEEPDYKRFRATESSSPEQVREQSPFEEVSTATSDEPASHNTAAPLSSISTLLSASEHEDGFFACGMCTSGTEGCACRDPLVALRVPQVKEEPVPVVSSAVSKLPITLKKTGGPSVWRLDSAVAAAPACSGNPADCPACADDKQGQEFCRSLRSSVPTPRRRSSTLSGSSLRSEGTTPEESEEKLIYCSDAWMELRAHPNIASANLNMLADIVSHDATSEVQGKQTHQQTQPSSASSTQQQQQQEWRRRLVIKRKGLDEAIKMLDKSSQA